MKLVTCEGIEESIAIAFDDAQKGNVERASARARLAQAGALLLIVESLDKLLKRLDRWDCEDQLSVAITSPISTSPIRS